MVSPLPEIALQGRFGKLFRPEGRRTRPFFPCIQGQNPYIAELLFALLRIADVAQG
jgi:hypothetical protein